VRSCGRAEKRDGTRRQVEHLEVLGTCRIGGTPSRSSQVENSTVITRWHDYRQAPNACQ
jgi:hypothetical protein